MTTQSPPDSKGGETPETISVCEPGGDAGSQPRWVLLGRGLGAVEDAVYQNATAYPRAYLARSVRVVAPEGALEAVLDVACDLRQQSVVEEPLGGLAPNAAAPEAGEATIEYDGAEEVRIRTRSASAALLVLSDHFDPNWRVEIDDTLARPVRANYLFRGVAVPAGEHLVRWSYRPASVVWGCMISAATLITLGGFTIVESRTFRRVRLHIDT